MTSAVYDKHSSNFLDHLCADGLGEHSKNRSRQKRAVCLFRRKKQKQEESGHSLCSPPSRLPVTQLFLFWLARGSFNRLLFHRQCLLLTGSWTVQRNIMSLELAFFVAFLTGVSGSPSLRMRPEIDYRLNPSSGVPDTAGEARFSEQVRIKITS